MSAQMQGSTVVTDSRTCSLNRQTLCYCQPLTVLSCCRLALSWAASLCLTSGLTQVYPGCRWEGATTGWCHTTCMRTFHSIDVDILCICSTILKQRALQADPMMRPLPTKRTDYKCSLAADKMCPCIHASSQCRCYSNSSSSSLCLAKLTPAGQRFRQVGPAATEAGSAARRCCCHAHHMEQ